MNNSTNTTQDNNKHSLHLYHLADLNNAEILDTTIHATHTKAVLLIGSMSFVSSAIGTIIGAMKDHKESENQSANDIPYIYIGMVSGFFIGTLVTSFAICMFSQCYRCNLLKRSNDNNRLRPSDANNTNDILAPNITTQSNVTAQNTTSIFNAKNIADIDTQQTVAVTLQAMRNTYYSNNGTDLLQIDEHELKQFEDKDLYTQNP